MVLEMRCLLLSFFFDSREADTYYNTIQTDIHIYLFIEIEA